MSKEMLNRLSVLYGRKVVNQVLRTLETQFFTASFNRSERIVGEITKLENLARDTIALGEPISD